MEAEKKNYVKRLFMSPLDKNSEKVINYVFYCKLFL